MRHKPAAALVCICFLLLPLTVGECGAGNFVCSDVEVRQTAEAARVRSARFWSGNTLPGDWFAPCPIQVFDASHAGCGKTKFQFTGGEVSGWQMEVAGNRAAILQDVIPHEVDHMVRASLVRRRIERWLDEGCAVLMESCVVHQHQRQVASQQPAGLITQEWLERSDYPQTVHESAALYAVGFSLVEYLLTRGTPAQLLEFQRDSSAMAVRLQSHYGLSVDALRSGWESWMRQRGGSSCAEARCVQHFLQAGREGRPVLVIWTAEWCQPCQKFKSDLAADRQFREKLESAYELQFQDFDASPNLRSAQGVLQVPTFIFGGRQFIGYQTADELLDRLGLNSTRPQTTRPSSIPQPPSPQPSQKPKPPPVNAPAEVRGVESDGWKLLQWVPITLSALQWAGVIGGSVATGGVGGALCAGAMLLYKSRLGRRTAQTTAMPDFMEGGGESVKAPFPRQLDEAGELLQLRQTEGRVATLDTLRGMFLDDELEKLEQQDSQQAQLALKLRKAIAARVDEVAPLTTQV